METPEFSRVYRFFWKDGYQDFLKLKIPDSQMEYKRHIDDRDDRFGVEGWLTKVINNPKHKHGFAPGELVTFVKRWNKDLGMVFVEV